MKIKERSAEEGRSRRERQQYESDDGYEEHLGAVALCVLCNTFHGFVVLLRNEAVDGFAVALSALGIVLALRHDGVECGSKASDSRRGAMIERSSDFS